MTAVQPGDSLWPIAQRFHGDGEHVTLLFEATDGRVQRDGWALNHHGVIYPDWTPRLPDAAWVIAKELEGGANKTTTACERRLVVDSLALPASRSRRTSGQ
jgi:hypothetical protein